VRSGPLVIGIVVAVVVIAAAGVAAAILLKSGGPDKSAPTSAQLITLTPVTTRARP
jgi:flagellar basal body-associated protein FliL